MTAGQFDWGGFLQKSNGGVLRFPQHGWQSCVEHMGRWELNCETHTSNRYESRPKWSGGWMWNRHRSSDKRYAGDNRLIASKSSYRRCGLAPRCRLIASWGWRRSQGSGCSPVKAVRELGSERRETVRSLSTVGVGNLTGSLPSTRGPGVTDLWCSSCRVSGSAG